ncbi:MAG TPA: hypothetical protein VLJ37_10975 [bacterium]|nr:hypothetical protein [bacterium]
MFRIPLSLPPYALSGTPRVFVNPLVPVWIDPAGGIQLPLTMDASTTDIGVRAGNPEGLATWIAGRRPYFASRDPEFRFFASEGEYRAAVHPAWLDQATGKIDEIVRSYAGTAARLLHDRWSRIHPLLAATLYAGQGTLSPGDFFLIPQDLSLFGAPFDPANDLFGLLHLLETFAMVDGLFAAGLTDRIQIAGETGLRELHDAPPKSEDPWLEVIDGFGASIRVPKSEIRPFCILEEDADGRVDSMTTGSATVHVAYDRFQIELVQLNALLIGAYLFAHFGLTDDELKSLAARISHDEGMGLFAARDDDIVLQELKRRGWNPSPRDAAAVGFITAAVRRLRTTA